MHFTLSAVGSELDALQEAMVIGGLADAIREAEILLGLDHDCEVVEIFAEGLFLGEVPRRKH